jgi:hypothetical protein
VGQALGRRLARWVLCQSLSCFLHSRLGLDRSDFRRGLDKRFGGHHADGSKPFWLAEADCNLDCLKCCGVT